MNATPDPTRWLIVNADDFGASQGTNEGIERAHRRGIVTSASLMVNMAGTDDAVRRATSLGRLGLGLHVNLTNEWDDPVVDIDDLGACEVEMAAQLQRFCDLMGRLPDHIDAQHNVNFLDHLRPAFEALASGAGLPLRGSSPVPYFGGFYGRWDGASHPEQISVANLEMILGTHLAGHDVVELACHPGLRHADLRSE